MRSPEQTMKALERKGYKVERLTSYQFRIECVFDLYVIRFRWHNIANNTRGSWHGLNEQQLINLIDQQVALADAILDRMIVNGEITEDGEPIVRGNDYPKSDVDSAIWWTQKGLQRSKLQGQK